MITFLKELFKRKTRLEKLIEKADRYYKVSGKQYFVMPTKKVSSKDYDKTLILVHGKTFRDEYNEKARKLGTKLMSYAMMCNQCVYMTNPGRTQKREIKNLIELSDHKKTLNLIKGLKEFNNYLPGIIKKL